MTTYHHHLGTLIMLVVLFYNTAAAFDTESHLVVDLHKIQELKVKATHGLIVTESSQASRATTGAQFENLLPLRV